jgi:hypothetical protein
MAHFDQRAPSDHVMGCVLKDEIANGSSPRSLTVLSAYGSQATKNTPLSVSSGEFKPSTPVPSKRTLSWAEIASR